MNKKKYIVLIAIVATINAGIIVISIGPQIHRNLSINSAVEEMTARCRDGKPDEPEFGGIVECSNGEWIVIELHGQALGFTLAYTSKKEAFVETDYNPHPAIECWGGIISGERFGGYVSIEDFFEKNNTINWQEK